MKPLRIVVTGASGYIATRLIDELPRRFSCEIIRVSRRTHDLTQLNVWPTLLKGTDILFLLGAQTSVSIAERDVLEDARVNVLPISHLLEACKQGKNMPLILFAGSVTQRGIPRDLPVAEDQPDEPVTVYDRHKLAVEKLLEDSASAGIVRATTLRLSNVYGPGPKSGAADRGILNQMIKRALQGDALTVHGEGKELRDYTFIDDVVEAFVLAAQNPERVNARHFVIGTGHGTSLSEAFHLIADRVRAKVGRSVEVHSIDRPKGSSKIDTRSFIADSRAFQAATGWRPTTTLAHGIELTLQSLLCPPRTD